MRSGTRKGENVNDIIVIGSSGHAKEVIDIIEQDGRFNILGLIDTYKKPGEVVLGYKVLGEIEALSGICEKFKSVNFAIAIGDNNLREEIVSKVENLVPKAKFPSIIHPFSSVASSARLGLGVVVMPGVSINAQSSVGNFCILNTNSSIDHDSKMDDYSSLAPGVSMGGGSELGRGSAACIGSIISHKVKIGACVVLGAGSLALCDLSGEAVYVGSPCRFLRRFRKGDRYL